MRLRSIVSDETGAAAAELVLILPAVFLVFVNVADVSMFIWSRMQVDLAAQEAVGAARVMCDEESELPATLNCGGSLATTMTAAAQTTSLGSNVSISGTQEAFYCADATGTLISVAAADGTPPADCSATVTDSTSEPGIYISTQASYTFTPMFPAASVVSVLPATITRTAWIRLQ